MTGVQLKSATPGPAALSILVRFRVNSARMTALWDQAAHAHPNQWMAVTSTGEFFDADYKALLARLQDLGELATAAVDYLATEPDRFVGGARRLPWSNVHGR